MFLALSSTKKFWDILKRCTNAKKSNVEVPLTELYEYFKKINSSDEEYEQNNDINNYNYLRYL
jgi:hypothetical protein